MSEIDRLNRLLMEHIQVNEDQNDRIQELQRLFLNTQICPEIQRKRMRSTKVRR